MSLSDFQAYSKSIGRKKGGQEPDRLKCWRGRLVASDREIWREYFVAWMEEERLKINAEVEKREEVENRGVESVHERDKARLAERIMMQVAKERGFLDTRAHEGLNQQIGEVAKETLKRIKICVGLWRDAERRRDKDVKLWAMRDSHGESQINGDLWRLIRMSAGTRGGEHARAVSRECMESCQRAVTHWETRGAAIELGGKKGKNWWKGALTPED